jgi:hypothetical protein
MEVDVFALGGLIVSVFSVCALYFGVITGIKERLTALEVKTDLFWKAIQENMLDFMKHPSEPRKDVLLGKLLLSTITPEELVELKGMLKSGVNMKPQESMATALTLGRIEMLLFDQKRMGRWKK